MFHRLRVLNFSKSFLSDCTSRSKPKKEIETESDEIPKRKVSSILKVTTNQTNNRTKQSNHDKVPVSSKEIRKRPCVTYNDVEEDNSEWEPSSPMFQRNFTIPKKSLSETLTCPSKKYIFQNLSHRKTVSLIDVKKRMTTKRHKYCKNIKLAFQSLRKDVTVKKPPKIITRQPQDMKLVFVCSSRNPLQSKTAGTVTCNNTLTHRRRQRRSDASTSYSDIFGFRNKKKVFNRYSYQKSNEDDSFFQKLKRRSDTKRKNINGYFRTCSRLVKNVSVVSSGLRHHSSYRSSNRLHYNLVDFPRRATNKRRSKESTRLTKNKLIVKNDSNVFCSRCCNAPRECKNTSVSCINLKLICKDVACGTNRSVLFDKPSPKTSASCSRLGRPAFTRPKSCGPLKQSTRPNCRKCLKKNVSFKKRRKSVLNEASFIKSSVFHRFQGYSEKFYHKRDIQGKTVFKYVILAIVAVAWSPCLLAIACGWLLTYPLRPHQIIPDNGIGKCQKECSSYYNNNNNSFWALMVGNMKNAFHKTMSTGSAIKSLLVPENVTCKAKSLQINSSPTLINSGPTELPKYPNPQRRYTLCYDAVRGWVMKPVRQRKRSRAGFSVISQVIQKYLCGCGFTSNNTRQGVCAYNVTARTKPNYEYPGPNVSDTFKSIKSSITYKQPVTAKSKHCEPQDKCLYTNPFKKKSLTDAHRKCNCHDHHNKTYTDKKTGDENTSYKLSSKIPKESETRDHDIERTNRNPLASPKNFKIDLTDQRHRPLAQKSILSRRSTIEEKELYPSSICRKCGQRHSGIELETSSICKECFKPHFGQSPQSLRKHSAARIFQQQQDNKDTNVLLPRRSQRRRTISEKSSAFILNPKRSMSEISIHHTNRDFLAYNIPKRSLSESSRGQCCTCKSPQSRCKKGDIGRRYSEYLERRASEIVGPQMKRPSILSKERSAHQVGGPEQKRSRISFKEQDGYQVGGPEKKRSRSSIKERRGYKVGGPEQKRSRSSIKERAAQKRSNILEKKPSLKKNLTRSPGNERFDIKVKRKKKRKIPESEEKKSKYKKRTLFTKPVILIQKIVPATRKKRKKLYKYCGGKWLNRCDKKCRDGIWPMHLECRHLYLYTMKKRPCFWVYNMCPNCYPSFLGFYSCCRGCFQACMFCLSLILWSPVFLCLYCCYLCTCESCCR